MLTRLFHPRYEKMTKTFPVKIYYVEKLHTVNYICISQCSKTAKNKLFINYKRKINVLAHLNFSTANFKCPS